MISVLVCDVCPVMCTLVLAVCDSRPICILDMLKDYITCLDFILRHNISSTRDRKFRALEKSPDPGAPGEIGNINPPAPGAPAFRILTPDRGPRGRGMQNITIISEFFSKNNTQY